MKDTKQPDLLWAAVRGLLIFVFFPASSLRHESFKINGLIRNINGLDPEIENLTEPIFQLGFNRGYHINKRAHRDPNFLVQSLPLIEMAFTVEL